MSKGVRVGREAELRGLSWVVITGIVPIAKQEVQFEDAFRNVIKPMPEQDLPNYFGYRIERAEIKDGAADPVWQEIKWKEVNKKFRDRWASEASEVVDPAYVHDYTEPSAPLVGADWDPAAVGHPKVPLRAQERQSDDGSATAGRGRRRRRRGRVW